MQNSMALRGNPFKRAWAAYERQLERHPVPTQVATSCLLWGVGDLLAQRIEHYERQQEHKKAVAATVAVPGVAPGSSVLQPASDSAAAAALAAAAAAEPTLEIDWRRAVLTGIFGATFVGPVGHYWYLNLDKWCLARFKPGSPTFIATKVVLDTVTMGPFYVTSFFGFGTAFMDGGGWQEFSRKMRTDFWPTLIAEVTFWPFVQTLNFSKVPVQHQLLVVNSMTVLDAAFMSWARNQDDWLGRLLASWKGEAEAKQQQQQLQQQEEEQQGGSKAKGGPRLPTTPLQLPAPGAKH